MLLNLMTTIHGQLLAASLPVRRAMFICYDAAVVLVATGYNKVTSSILVQVILVCATSPWYKRLLLALGTF
jgi:hypothetical protein